MLHSYKMPAQLIDGKAISNAIRSELSERISTLEQAGVIPGLGVILVGNDPASLSYVKSKRRACDRLGIRVRDIYLPEDSPEQDLVRQIQTLNQDDDTHGILLQLPLPHHLDGERIIERIQPSKDVDGFHPVNLGRLLAGNPGIASCTPAAIVALLSRSGISTVGKHVVIVGRSNIVGKPLGALLMQDSADGNATVTLCHSKTQEIASHTRVADIVVVAAGVPGLLTGEMISKGAVVIDVGINRIEDSNEERGYRLVGDVEFESVSEKASMITPVPGGVGPMTITMLLSNTIRAAERSTPNG